MSLSAITQPHTYMAAYSAVPLKIFSNDYLIQEDYKYLVSVTWDFVLISNDTSVNIGTNVFTKLTTTTPHNFKIGDTVFLNDSINSNQFTGYYIVQAIISPTEFAIDLIPNAPFASSGYTCEKVLKWKLNPDLDGYGKVDLSTSLKDFVSQNLTGQSVTYGLSYDAPDTRFCFDIYCGSQQQYSFSFDDNYFSGGSAGFVASGMTGLTGIPFQIGDVVRVQQDTVAWNYDDNLFFSGSWVGYTGSTPHSFLPGQSIIVTGQQTFPYYNGQNSVQSATTFTLSTFKGWQGNTPAEPGVIYGVPRPSYNTTATITNILYQVGVGVIIVTDIPWAGNSVAIPGNIFYADGRITEFPNQLKIDDICVYNAHLNQNEYSITGFDKYVVQNRAFSGNNISTILNQSNCYRIQPSTIGFLLTHMDDNRRVEGLQYEFYNSANGILGSVLVEKQPTTSTDFYAPIGLEQIARSNYIDFLNPFTGYSGDVKSYYVWAYDTSGTTQMSNKLCFTLNNDCSMYEVYHLMWKDKFGSFISYPFIYKSRDNISVDRRTYYKQEGSWDNNTFQYYDYGNGEKNFYVKSRKSFVLNSGWLYQFETQLIEDLMQSASVYIQTPDNRLYQCHLTETATELYKLINEDLFSYTFNVRVSNNEFRF